MRCLPYTHEQLTQARQALTAFDALCRDHGPAEAEALRQTAWDMLTEDRAARIDASWMAVPSPRDAA